MGGGEKTLPPKIRHHRTALCAPPHFAVGLPQILPEWGRGLSKGTCAEGSRPGEAAPRGVGKPPAEQHEQSRPAASSGLLSLSSRCRQGSDLQKG